MRMNPDWEKELERQIRAIYDRVRSVISSLGKERFDLIKKYVQKRDEARLDKLKGDVKDL